MEFVSIFGLCFELNRKTVDFLAIGAVIVGDVSVDVIFIIFY
jgi:hypothetical protein